MTYTLAPLDWTPRMIHKAIGDAQRSYLEALEQAKADDPEPRKYWNNAAFYDQHPNKTVGEAKALLQEENEKHKAWEKRQRDTKRKFSDFLRDQGFLSFWEDGAGIATFDVDWGHRHGVPIDYGEMGEGSLDTLPRPIKIASPEWEDDEFFG